MHVNSLSDVKESRLTLLSIVAPWKNTLNFRGAKVFRPEIVFKQFQIVQY